jgi:hypothetical protein
MGISKKQCHATDFTSIEMLEEKKIIAYLALW